MPLILYFAQMWIFKRADAIQRFLQEKTKADLQTGFVPTMGALHEGHISLINESRQDNHLTICSIFVNPAQFNDKADFDKYPRTINKDIAVLVAAGCDVLFLPDVEDIYPDNFQSKHYELGFLETVFEGSFRPGHFQGVCRVVDRLFNIINPDQVYFGQKDYQQCMVINKLIENTSAFAEIKMNIIPTLREKSGLAMSSRNTRLNEAQLKIAPVIYNTLLQLKSRLHPGNLSGILTNAEAMLLNAGLKPDYISIANAKTLEPVTTWDGQTPLVALVAAFLEDVRLIDNLVLTD